MNFDDYKNDGWGLCQSGFKDLYKLICEHEKDNLSILEFGSGTSTRFFVDVANSKVKNLVIESYDNDIKWCFQNAEDYDFLDLKIRNLVECDDKNFASMLLRGRKIAFMISKKVICLKNMTLLCLMDQMVMVEVLLFYTYSTF
jgi:hypothetical protein